jgi:hypothetical protein
MINGRGHEMETVTSIPEWLEEVSMLSKMCPI